MLEEGLKLEILSKRRRMLTNGAVFHHDDARPHTIRKLKFGLLPHPAYSPESVPSDYNIFGLLKDALRGHRFVNDEKFKDKVQTWLRAQSKTFFADGIRKLVDRRNKMYGEDRRLRRKMTVCFFLCTFCRTKKIINCPYFFNSRIFWLLIKDLGHFLHCCQSYSRAILTVLDMSIHFKKVIIHSPEALKHFLSYIWLKIGTSGGCCGYGNKPSVS
jgi:hypothetical protein